MYYLRYGGGLKGADLESFRNYGTWIILGAYVLLVILAFKDTVFQGILALLLPGYPIYWLFLVSDLFMLRAILAGMMVGFGADFAILAQAWLNERVSSGQEWIESGAE